MKNFFSLTVLIFVIIMTFVSPQKADAKTAVTSAVLTTPNEILEKAEDNRVEILRDYLESRNSPLAESAKTFVYEADKNDLDWRLVAAISGLESSFGIHIPAYSYNGWGYGVYGNNVRRFSSWDEGVTTVSKALREEYMNKWNAQTIPEIGRIYAASPTWAVRVQYFIDSIDEFEKDQSRTTLALSL
jgi:hypothetical protein